ncbi:MAG TPA: hypothetical protein VNW97_10295 [Candidatus Saccharimonadales bacterium]|jgi:hypothetical protein|nr:hypothetical protein [Candidatus Saccharimonadales bacterium]
MSSSGRIPPEVSIQLRALAHDLSNSLEAITQASYLLARMDLDEGARKWSDLIDQAGREAIRINQQIREVLRSAT